MHVTARNQFTRPAHPSDASTLVKGDAPGVRASPVLPHPGPKGFRRKARRHGHSAFNTSV